ncbi:hypothetical protein VKT23_015252 [Stygiomarasmius scandens]|uniref:Uncharacterized protein n=1 Tax=Marasmiellus scandens TaxID=2682957 RepID=A0ABR1IYR1_9AGAR
MDNDHVPSSLIQKDLKTILCTTRNIQLCSRNIQTLYTDVSAPPRPRKRVMLLDCMELPSALTRQNTSAVPLPVDPVDEEPSISSGPNRSNATATASLSSTSAGNARPVSSKQPGPDLGSLVNLSPEQLDSAPTTTCQPVQGVPGLMQTVDRNGKVVMGT